MFRPRQEYARRVPELRVAAVESPRKAARLSARRPGAFSAGLPCPASRDKGE
jgi:hypothetical protein